MAAKLSDAITAARTTADEAIAARQAAKDEAGQALARVAALESQLLGAQANAVAASAGAKDPQLVAAQIPSGTASDKLAEAVAALKQRAPYMFDDGSPSTPPAPPTAPTGGFDFTHGHQQPPTPAVDAGLAGFGAELSKLSGKSS